VNEGLAYAEIDNLGDTAMPTVSTHTAIVRPGGVIEIRDPALPEGRTVQVTISFEESATPEEWRGGLMRFFGAARGSFATPEEADAFIRAERDAWER
jgi:hypothetical protein